MSIFSIVMRLVHGAKNGLVLTSGLLILLSLAIWFYGPAFRYMDYAPFAPVMNRIIAIGVLVVLWGINNYFLARKQAAKKPKQKREEKPVHDPLDALILLMNQSFRNMIKTLRGKWVGSERGQSTLYALPWYLVIGPSNAGKSSLIQDADLNFPLSHLLDIRADEEAVAHELPQYWVTNEALLFDIPGRWLNKNAPVMLDGLGTSDAAPQEGEEEETSTPPRPAASVKGARKRLWHAFLDLLVDHRSRRPINGVIINFDLMEMIRMNERQREAAAANIHAHLVDIAEKLGTRFTVHVVMTKLDRFAGFADYFGTLPKGEQKQPFGFSFPIYDELQADQWVEDFTTASAQFLSSANDDMIDQLYHKREIDGRRNSYIFLRELTSSIPIVQDFWRRALISDKFSTPPLMRGIYFTSVRQEGVPVNVLLHRIALDYHMNPPVLRAFSGQSVRFFSDTLFRDIIFKESGLAGDNKQVESRKKFALNATIVASVLFVLGFGFLLNEAMQDNRARAENVISASNDFINLPRDKVEGSDESRYIAALNAIASANEEFPHWQDKSEARRYLALYQGRQIGPEVEKAYEDLLRQRFLPAIAEEVKAEIVRLGQDEASYSSDERLDALRVYLLLGSIDIRQQLDGRSQNSTSLSRAAVMSWLQRSWQQRFEGKSQLQGDLRRHLLYALGTNRIASPVDTQMVEETREALLEVPRDVRLYRTLKSSAAKQVPGGISLRSQLGPAFDMIFKQKSDELGKTEDIVIPYFYTKRGFHDFFVPRSDDLSILALEDAWVTGESRTVHYSEEDLENFRQKIRHAYVSDYISHWTRALDQLDIVDFGTMEHATRVIADINGPHNPFGRLVALIKNETEIYEPLPVASEEIQDRTELALNPNREHGQRIARAFHDLAQMLDAPEGKTAPFEEILTPMAGLESYMRAILSGQISSRPLALERAKERANLQGNDPIFLVRRTGANLPEPLRRFFTQIADNSWKSILAAAKIDLQSVWQSNVYRTFNIELSGKYPFNREGREEVTLAEFQKFFGPNGDFDAFFNDNLKVFINPDNGQPILIDGQSLVVSAEFMRQVATARSLRNIFFTSDGVPTLHYTVEPLSMTGNISRAVLNIEGQLVPYSHGPTTPKSILWPNALSSKQDISQLSLSQQGGTVARTHQGLWSSFRLFEQAEVSDATAESVDVTFKIGNSRVKYRLRMAATQRNPFAMRSLSQLKLPEQL